ncbi:MAG: hypothetical protein ACK2T6_03935 [Anaerolineae bacterium]
MTVTRTLVVMLLVITALAGATLVAGCSSPTQSPADSTGDVGVPGGSRPSGANESDIGPVDAPREGGSGYPALRTAPPPVDAYAGPDDAAAGEDASESDEAGSNDEGTSAENGDGSGAAQGDDATGSTNSGSDEGNDG